MRILRFSGAPLLCVGFNFCRAKQLNINKNNNIYTISDDLAMMAYMLP